MKKLILRIALIVVLLTAPVSVPVVWLLLTPRPTGEEWIEALKEWWIHFKSGVL